MEFILGIGSRIKHPDFGQGVVINVRSDTYMITFLEYGIKPIGLNAPLEVIHRVEMEADLISLFDVERTLVKILQKWTDLAPLQIGDKWKGGKMILQPGRKDLQSKEIPIDTFFSKIIMMRDRLRVLEQRVNASQLDADDKINMQQYITKCYGSMTTFNVLFADQSDYFVGEKGSN
jgi:hypothetical protein